MSRFFRKLVLPSCKEEMEIRKVKLRMDEEKKYMVIKKLVDSDGNKERAALELGVTKRHINRMIRGYREQGKAFFLHGNRGRRPATTLPAETRHMLVDLYRAKYYDANFTHYTELLTDLEGIHVSVSSVTSALEAAGIYSPRITKARKKRIRHNLRIQQENTRSKRKKSEILSNLVALEDAHSRRPRCAYAGELLQMDAFPYLWFGNSKTTLHIAVDDATGSITGAWFDKEETLNSYYHVFHQILVNYGIPCKFFTDRRTVFEYKQKKSPSVEEDTYTQFAYACKQLGVDIETSSIPQAKGRVERMFETLQSRLPIELRLAGITEIPAANIFLESYLRKYNVKFSLQTNNIKSVYEVQPSDEKINLILSVITGRTVDSGHCIKYANHYYRMLNRNGMQVHYLKGTKVMLIKAFDGSYFCSVNDKEIYALEEVPAQEIKSRLIDNDFQKAAPRPRYIPEMNHPWRSRSFWKFVKQQEHNWDSGFDVEQSSYASSY